MSPFGSRTTRAEGRSVAGWLLILAMLLGSLVAGSYAAEQAPEAAPLPPASVYIVLVGDSTVTDSAGWGRAFADLLLPTVRCTNTARGGQSTKSFLDGGSWAKALALHPTHVLIQFGHNDQPGKGPNRETDPRTTYRANLIRYVDEARAAGVRPILVTSLTRRVFLGDKLRDNLAPYAEAMKAVAAEKHVPLVDLHARSVEAVERLGPVASEELGPLTKDGKRDRSHLAEPGKVLTAQLVVTELRRVAPELSACFRPTP
ncbi:MAG TPA: rhamnogalacturonan acetylesterase [Pirellulales bacterium]